MTIHIEDTCVGAVFGLVDALDVDAVPGIRDVGVREGRGVGEEEGDQETAQAEDDAEPKLSEPVVDVHWVDDAIVVGVPEQDVLLKSGELFAFRLGGWVEYGGGVW